MLTGIKMQDTINLIKGGYRHAQPEGCPDVVYEQLSFIYRLKLYALFINGKMRLPFIDSDLLYICHLRQVWLYFVLLRCWSEDPNDRATFGFLYNFLDTVTVINEGNQEDDPCSTESNLFNLVSWKRMAIVDKNIVTQILLVLLHWYHWYAPVFDHQDILYVWLTMGKLKFLFCRKVWLLISTHYQHI
jgi:hypothetical protein